MNLHYIEKRTVILLNQHKSKFLDVFSASISNVPFLVFFWIAVAMAVIYFDFLTGIFLVLGLVIVFALHFIISEGIFKWGGKKLSLARVRPYLAYPDEIKGIGRKFSDSSFPSSHLAAMVGGLFVLVYFYKALLAGAILIAILMGWSRLRNGMHYPSDVLAGILLGLLYGFLALQILKILI